MQEFWVDVEALVSGVTSIMNLFVSVSTSAAAAVSTTETATAVSTTEAATASEAASMTASMATASEAATSAATVRVAAAASAYWGLCCGTNGQKHNGKLQRNK